MVLLADKWLSLVLIAHTPSSVDQLRSKYVSISHRDLVFSVSLKIFVFPRRSCGPWAVSEIGQPACFSSRYDSRL